MILLELKKYFTKVECASLWQIMQQFGLEEDVARSMLHHWISKGFLQSYTATPICGQKCFRCDPLTTEIYCLQTNEPVLRQC